MGMLDDQVVLITGAGRGIGPDFALPIHRGEGWTPETIVEHAIPALKSGFMDLVHAPDVWCRDPV